MPEDRPIIIDGHAQKITITLPSSFKMAKVGEAVTIEVESGPGTPFESVVVRDAGEADPTKSVFRTPGMQKTWNIKIE
jgi:hypothetical protein